MDTTRVSRKFTVILREPLASADGRTRFGSSEVVTLTLPPDATVLVESGRKRLEASIAEVEGARLVRWGDDA